MRGTRLQTLSVVIGSFALVCPAQTQKPRTADAILAEIARAALPESLA